MAILAPKALGCDILRCLAGLAGLSPYFGEIDACEMMTRKLKLDVILQDASLDE